MRIKNGDHEQKNIQAAFGDKNDRLNKEAKRLKIDKMKNISNLLLLLCIIAVPNSLFAQELTLVDKGEGLFQTNPLSPLTDVPTNPVDINKFTGSESDLFCNASVYKDTFILTILRPNLSTNPPPQHLEVYFGDNIRFKATTGKKNGMDHIFCSLTGEDVFTLLDADFSSIKLVYPNGMTMSFPIRYENSVYLHLGMVLNFNALSNQPFSSNILCHTTESNKNAERVNGCTDIVYEILTSSKAFKERAGGFEIKEWVNLNGGFYYDVYLWDCPHDDVNDENHSLGYKLDLHQVYFDRHPRMASFVFDPKKQVLYIGEWNRETGDEDLVSIPFNRDLLLKFNQACN